jgi:hypothetical protein
LPHLSPDDPMAKALAYHNDAASVDPSHFPSFRSEQKCSTCDQLQGQKGQAWRPCALFPDTLVNADGWCRAWAPKIGPD